MRETPAKSARLLGIEAGGTRTVALLASTTDELMQRQEFGPGNLRILTDQQLLNRFQQVALAFEAPESIGVGMAGLRDSNDQKRLETVVSACWPGVPFRLGNDLESALRAAADDDEAKGKMIVLSGTGSCCYGRNRAGKTAKVGGWGHILGDKGSGYEIGLRGLKAAVYYLDRDGVWSRLGERILRALVLNEPNDLIGWVQRAGKDEIAGLAREVFAAAAEKDKIARDILEGAANNLAKDGVNCARRICGQGERVQFVLTGGVLIKQPGFAARVRDLLMEKWPNSTAKPLERESVWGCVELAKEVLGRGRGDRAQSVTPGRNFFWPELEPGKSPTEQRNAKSTRLHQLDAARFVELMLKEEAKVIPALLKEQKTITAAAEMVAKSLRSGGRLFYAGAGTSGRLGVLDASECPPTFRADPEQVQGIIAGGQRALWEAVEGAEDNPEAGAAAVRSRGVRKGDVLAGIAASGRTPFVWGALAEARKIGATTVLICFNPGLKIPAKERPKVIICADLGPEVLTGSTRLKSGTATKLVLNILSTYSMVQLGKVISNLMVDLHPSNVKLRDRAIRIVRELTGVEAGVAQKALARNGWVIKDAWKELAGETSRHALSTPAPRRNERTSSKQKRAQR